MRKWLKWQKQKKEKVSFSIEYSWNKTKKHLKNRNSRHNHKKIHLKSSPIVIVRRRRIFLFLAFSSKNIILGITFCENLFRAPEANFVHNQFFFFFFKSFLHRRCSDDVKCFVVSSLFLSLFLSLFFFFCSFHFSCNVYVHIGKTNFILMYKSILKWEIDLLHRLLFFVIHLCFCNDTATNQRVNRCAPTDWDIHIRSLHRQNFR